MHGPKSTKTYLGVGWSIVDKLARLIIRLLLGFASEKYQQIMRRKSTLALALRVTQLLIPGPVIVRGVSSWWMQRNVFRVVTHEYNEKFWVIVSAIIALLAVTLTLRVT